MEHFFKTKQLTVGYGGKPLIRDIEIGLKKGQILTLIGPNGSGKSTILKSITKQLAKIGGTVYIGESSIDDMSYRDMSFLVSVVLTDRLKAELMTCEDVVSTGRYPYTGMLGILSAEDKVKVREAMELVNAWELRDRSFSEISDGQKQRVLLARAICQEPEVIILDEPTSFLDVRYQLELLQILRQMSEEKKITVILSLHEVDMAQKISDLVLCVKGETISHFGTPEEIFTRELIGELYDLNNGSYNALFGGFEMQKPKGEASVFVIGGGGSGIAAYRELARLGVPFAAGVLHENDIDYQVAEALAAHVVCEKAFCAISDEKYAEALDVMESCGSVLYCLKETGDTNRKNAGLLNEARRMGLELADSLGELAAVRSAAGRRKCGEDDGK